jgi:hypothetical protein
MEKRSTATIREARDGIDRREAIEESIDSRRSKPSMFLMIDRCTPAFRTPFLRVGDPGIDPIRSIDCREFDATFPTTCIPMQRTHTMPIIVLTCHYKKKKKKKEKKF